MIKYAPSLFTRDGNYNISGYMLKTLMFGVSVYGLSKLTKTLSESNEIYIILINYICQNLKIVKFRKFKIKF